MKTDAINLAPSSPPPPYKRQINEAVEPPTSTQARAMPNLSETRQVLNQSILTASLEVSVSAGDNSMTLLYQTAIDHINSLLSPELDANALQKAYQGGLDVSPQATADRIVSMSTTFFSQYKEAHPDKNLETALKDFVSLIGGGIDQGFSEARDILGGLKVLEGDIATNVDKTYERVQAGLKAFLEGYPRPETSPKQPA